MGTCIKSSLLLLAVAAGVALLAAPARADNTQGITDTTIKIGNLGPFTGEAAIFNPLNYGPDAYLRYINAQGGINGRKFETVFADDACNEAKGIAAAKKLIYEDKVFMIMSSPCSGVAMAIKPMIDKEGLPWIGIAANPKLTRPTVPSMFHVTYTGIE
ncbi:MAG: ABC transporter substrate-binding protein, partial [Alphaproteobacteria bacterium]